MKPTTQTILYFGDQTDNWINGIDQLYRQAAATPWIRSFLEDIVRVFKESSEGMDSVLQDSVGDYSTLLELADRYRYKTDEVGMAHAILLHAVRAGMLLQWVKQDPQLVSPSGPAPERLGISGGLLNLCALAISTDFESLYESVLEVAGQFVRLCRLTSVLSRAMEDRRGVWGWAVLGIAPENLRVVLDQYQHGIGVPQIKRVKVGVTGDGWSTIIGPPTILEQIVTQCPALRNLPKNALDIHALQHTVAVSEADMDFIIGNSVLLNKPILPAFQVWGMDDPGASYSSWGKLLKAVIFQVLSLPLDIPAVIEQLSSKLNSHRIDIRAIGPSSHTPYIVSTLQDTGRAVSLHTDKTLERPHASSSGKIAIVGMAGRGPGCDNLKEFWDVIMSKRDLCEEVPPDRFDIEEFYHHQHTEKCTSTSRFGCFMNKPGSFDARFFHVSPREALLMDPGHRQFLMSTYEALEMAGYSDGKTRTTSPDKVGVFYGQSNDDWHMVSHYTLGCDAYTLQGAQRAFGAGRAAFHFKWEGPTYSLDSACASTASATHIACMSLLSKDVDMAVVGAANILGYPHSWTSLSKSGVLSDTGNCKTYRDDADGYCRADFVGTVVLKRLEDAEAANDNILAVVTGSGRNHSGNSSSITTSDAGAQERLFRKVMRGAQVSPDDISYVETHGTGTQVGDPAEMDAITSIFKNRTGRRPVAIGGVKANIGHSEAAAGMASLLKCVMMFQNNILPPQAGMPHALNSKYPSLPKLNIEIPSEPKEFKAIDQRPRRVLLNNFDAAGGNACILLEDYAATTEKDADPRSCHVITTSAKTKTSYHANKLNLLRWLRENQDVKIQDVAYTTTARKMHHPIRFACTASTTQELIKKLEQDTAEAKPMRGSPLVFVFSGQGSHYAGMGSVLYATFPVFRETVDLCANICAKHGFPPFLDIIKDNDVDMSTKDTMCTQLAVLTLELGIAAFWRSCGLQPSVVVGHSLGEYAALQVAGVLSTADVLYLVGSRARLLLERCDAGAFSMVSIPTSTAAAQKILDQRSQSTCAIACSNSPSATVVSGTSDDVEEFRAALDTTTTRLSIPYGFHSFQMESILDDYIALAGGVTYSAPKIPVASTLLASVVKTAGVFDALYLGQQTRLAVDFVGALNAISKEFADPVWIEIGPSRVCSSFVQATLSPPSAKVLPTLKPSTNCLVSVSGCLAGAYNDGIDVDWVAFHAPFTKGLTLLTLPTYSWDSKDFWITYTEKNQKSQSLAPTTTTQVKLSTCAQYVVEELTTPTLRVALRAQVADPDFMALIDGHRIRGVPICPGSVFCEAAVSSAIYALRYGGRKDIKPTNLMIKDLTLKRPLTKDLASPEGGLLTTVVAEKPSNKSLQVLWKAASDKFTYELGSCVIAVSDADVSQAERKRTSYFARSRMNDLIKSVREGSGHRFLPSIFYALFCSTVEYDEVFKCTREAFISSNFEEAAAEVVLQRDPYGTQFTASPYWGESLIHLAGFLVNVNPDRGSPKTTFMMDSFESFEQFIDLEPEQSYFTYARVSQRDQSTTSCDVYVFDSQNLAMQCIGLRFHEVGNDVLDRLLGKPTPGPLFQERVHKTPKDSIPSPSEAKTHLPPPVVEHDSPQEEDELGSDEVFQVILASISKATGVDVSDMMDNTVLNELGVDSIMGIEIAAMAKNGTGLDILPSFVTMYPTVGDLRTAFGGAQASPSTPESSGCESAPSALAPAEDNSATITTITPSARITLIHGRRSSSDGRAFYLIADGTGSIATYIHLPPFKSKTPIYGVDSPYLRCPDQMAPEEGIVRAARYVVEALVKFQPEGNFAIGGFSGGAMIAYEVSRQLAAAGRGVDSLLLIDMCCPRKAGIRDEEEVGWRVYESIATQGGSWNASESTQKHLRAVFASVSAYRPPTTNKVRPKRTAIIWAKKGLIDRCSGDHNLMRLLADAGIPTEPFPKFMEDARMGAIAWGLPHKTPADLGPNGWDKFVGEALCLSVDADHLEMPMPGHVHLLHGVMEEAFSYLSG
ncbi:non-reducing polyketide synthase [Thozetella sp. PMI_491]|nr:non-reducing polyketide synthase [Thozetella sp. PMI_491]